MSSNSSRDSPENMDSDDTDQARSATTGPIHNIRGQMGGTATNVFTANTLNMYSEETFLDRIGHKGTGITNSTIVSILKKATYELKYRLVPDNGLLDYLLSANALSVLEHESCKERSRRADQVGELLKILSYKGEDAYKKFNCYLGEKQKPLKELLDKYASEEAEASKHIYVSKYEMNIEVGERDNKISNMKAEMDRRSREAKTQKEELEDKYAKQERRHERDMNKAITEHASKLELKEKEIKKLHTLLNQETDRAQAVAEKMEEEKTARSRLEDEVEKLETRKEAFTALPTQIESVTLPDDITGIALSPGKCVLETTKECNNKQLLLLSCGHSICDPCYTQRKDETVLCKCGQDVNLKTAKLSPDFVGRNKAMLSAEGFECGYLTEPCRKRVVSHCITCNIPLCKSCKQNHGKLKANISHDVVEITKIAKNPPWQEPRNLTCTCRSQQQVIYFDEKCKLPICNVCYKGEHTGHQVKALGTKYNKKKKELEARLKDHEDLLDSFRKCLKERRERFHRLKTKHDKLEKNIRDTHERNAVRYRQRLNEILKSMREESKNMQTSVRDDFVQLKNHIATLEPTVAYAKMSSEFTSQVEFLELADTIMGRIQVERQRSIPEDRTQGTYIVFSSHGQNALDQLVDMFGEVKCSDKPDAEEDNMPTLKETIERCKVAEAEVEQLRKQIKELKKESGNLSVQKEKSEKEVKESQTKLQIAKSEINNSKTELKKREAEIIQSRTNLRKAEDEISHSKSELVKKEAEISHSKSELQKKEAAISHTRTELKQKEAQIEKSKIKLRDAETKITELQKELTFTEKFVNKLKSFTSYLWTPLREQGIHSLNLDTHDKSLILKCLQLKYDMKKVNVRSAHVMDDELINKPDLRRKTTKMFQKYTGTISTDPILLKDTPQYMEVLTTLSMEDPVEENSPMFETGLCREEHTDVDCQIPAQKHCISLTAVQCPEHRGVCTRVWKDGREVKHVSGTLPNEKGSYTVQHGALYDTAQKRVAFLDVGINQLKILAIMDGVDFAQPLWPMFGVFYQPQSTIKMKLVTGSDIELTDEKKTLIREALEKTSPPTESVLNTAGGSETRVDRMSSNTADSETCSSRVEEQPMQSRPSEDRQTRNSSRSATRGQKGNNRREHVTSKPENKRKRENVSMTRLTRQRGESSERTCKQPRVADDVTEMASK